MSLSIVQRACAKLRSAISNEAVVRLNFTADLREMLDALKSIQPILEQYEMRLRIWDDYNQAVAWLRYVNRAAYRVMDIVDELQDTKPPAAAMMTRMLPRLATQRNSMATKVNEMKNEVIRIKEFYDSYISEEESVITQQQQRLMDGRSTGPLFEEGSVFGRGADKQRIVTMLLSAASNITKGSPSCIILPIYGLAGIGKTTLAKMVFNHDTHSLQEYNIHVWVHVSPELDFRRIGESILLQVMSGEGEKEEINDHDSDSDVDSPGMEHIMKCLHELLNGKKVLLVLDDLWEEDPIQLQLLKSMLTFLGNKMDVIVTTCNQAIAREICTVVHPYRLNPLGDDTCWEIIKKLISFKEEDEELENIGRKIASKSWGVPLEAVEYASMLVGSRDPKKWKNIMKRNVSHRSGGSLQTFFLSYKSMPQELRLCFEYYRYIFPNGHSIVKDDLVHQWTALDFTKPSRRSSATEIAEGYITRLLDMSFFQTAESDAASGNDNKGSAMFTMHDMVHDFASWISREHDMVHYMLVTNCRGELEDQYDDYLRAMRCVGCSKVEFNDASFSSKRSLRVLELKESSIPKLPDSIYKLRHLGYLKISDFTGLITLTESFGDLNNLFHIELSGCSGLVNLSESFGKLIRLVHVNLSGCSGLVSLPESFGKLVNLVHFNLSGCTGLATLPGSFGNLVNLLHIDLSRCHRLSEILEVLQKFDKLVYLDLSFWSCFQGIGKCLGHLTNLEHLNLSNPCCHLAQQRSHLQELKDCLCKLTKLRYLNLSMCLNPIFYYKSEEDSLRYVESCVSDLSSLEHLDLSHNTFLFYLPESLGDLNSIHTLDLSGCIRLKKVGAIKSLKFLALKNCQALETCNFVVCVDEDAAVYSSSNLVQLEDEIAKSSR